MDVTGKNTLLLSSQISNNNGGFQLPASIKPGLYLLQVAGQTTRLVVR